MSGKFDNVLGAFGENSFLLLLLLFILLASCITWGRESNFFFIIILAVIAFGGFGRTFFGEGVF
ncbi:MAG: hypothetical protein ACOX89_07065 [Lutispora sp.]|jgi:hypothetical protein|uniref:hypothetical protein n=1 Tax=Lutispora sp. TaxID=2828727 RepID=UPI0035644CA5